MDRKTVTVRGVSVEGWKRLKALAADQEITLGEAVDKATAFLAEWKEQGFNESSPSKGRPGAADSAGQADSGHLGGTC